MIIILEMRQHAQRNIKFERELRLENVTYQYPQAKKETLKDIMLTVPKNTFFRDCRPLWSSKKYVSGYYPLGLLPVKSASIYCDDVDITPSIAIWIYHICCDMYLNILTL